MKHPDQQEWVAYLYREVDSITRSRLKSHLADCDACRAQLEQWQRVRQQLDAWPLPTRATKPRVLLPLPQLARWAAAAVLMIAFGFALGRSAGTSPTHVAALRKELRSELAQMLTTRLQESADAVLASANDKASTDLQQLVALYQSERRADKDAISTALARLEAARTADYLQLRKDLETVALNSDAGLRQTRQQLVRLADYRQAAAFTPPN